MYSSILHMSHPSSEVQSVSFSSKSYKARLIVLSLTSYRFEYVLNSNLIFALGRERFKQIRHMNKEKKSDGFSLWVCFTLILKSLLKISMYAIKDHTLGFLMSQIFMLVTQTYFIFTALKFKTK